MSTALQVCGVLFLLIVAVVLVVWVVCSWRDYRYDRVAIIKAEACEWQRKMLEHNAYWFTEDMVMFETLQRFARPTRPRARLLASEQGKAGRPRPARALCRRGRAVKKQPDKPLELTEEDLDRDTATLRDVLARRGVKEWDVCSRCIGYGTYLYGSTATWRRGIGGQAMTVGTCDVCWGSGSFSRRGPDLRLVSRSDHLVTPLAWSEPDMKKPMSRMKRIQGRVARAKRHQALGPEIEQPLGRPADLREYLAILKAERLALRAFLRQVVDEGAMPHPWMERVRRLLSDGK